MRLKGELLHSNSSLTQLPTDPSPGGPGSWNTDPRGSLYAQGDCQGKLGWTGNLVPDAPTGTGEIDGGQKGLSRKETIGPGKMVVWEVGNGAQYPGKCRRGQQSANPQENKTAPGVPGH